MSFLFIYFNFSLNSKVLIEALNKHVTSDEQILAGAQIDHVKVLDSILSSRQMRNKLQCLYENLMLNNFRGMDVLKKL